MISESILPSYKPNTPPKKEKNGIINKSLLATYLKIVKVENGSRTGLKLLYFKDVSDELKQNRKRQSEWTHKKTHKLSNIKMIDGKRQIETRHSHLESL